jgi:hypothetical protein
MEEDSNHVDNHSEKDIDSLVVSTDDIVVITDVCFRKITTIPG